MASRKISYLIGTALLLGFALSLPGQQAQSSNVASNPRALLDQYCVTCHSERLKTAGLRLDKDFVDPAHAAAKPEVWERVVNKLRAGAMPPAKMPRPPASVLDRFAASLEAQLDQAAAAKLNPGRTATFHRLNRTEYQNAIRDLLGVEVNAADYLPPDSSGELGFDNIASSLTVSPVLLERYVSSARKITQLALGGKSTPLSEQVYQLSSDYAQDNHKAELPFGTRGGVLVKHYFPADGDYTFKVTLVGNPAPGEPSQLDLRIDDERVHLFVLSTGAPTGGRGGGGGGAGRGGAPAPGAPAAGGRGGGGGFGPRPVVPDPEFRTPIKAGQHSVAVTFVGRPGIAPEIAVRRVQAVNYGSGSTHGLQYVSALKVTGPETAADNSRPPAFLSCQPASPADEFKCAKQTVASLARHAYRRPVTDADLEVLMPFYVQGREGKDFTAGLRSAVERILVSPDFLFRRESDPPSAGASSAYRISDLELASRLSFFLWSSIPDEALLEEASRGRLKDPAVLEKQLGRMLEDEKAQAFLTNFPGQWLHLREVDEVRPDPSVFPEADRNLRDSLRRQTELLFETVLREKRSVYELLTANFTFLNERLARHYGVPNIYGDHFRRLSLPEGDVRGGLLGQGSILMVTSYANRTSPVSRGKFVLDSLLGASPPPPPPDVPALKDTGETGKVLSMRDRMVQHRANPVCAGCHSRMDPLGFALETFDATGRSRALGEDGKPIDTSGELSDGTKFSGAAGLRDALLKHQEQFRDTVIEKLLTYSLGRELQYYDRPAIRAIGRAASASNYSLYQLVLGVIRSTPFQMRNTESAAAGLSADTEKGNRP